MEVKFELGQRVICSAYAKKTGNHYETDEGRDAYCTYWETGVSEGVLVEDFHSCDKFMAVPTPFKGVYVGTTILCTKIVAEWEEPPYGKEGFRFRSEEPKPFAVVYYADNKKRLVPMDAIWTEDEVEAFEEAIRNGQK